jgi:hypothetical protein
MRAGGKDFLRRSLFFLPPFPRRTGRYGSVGAGRTAPRLTYDRWGGSVQGMPRWEWWVVSLYMYI